jgi:hypothetical protein
MLSAMLTSRKKLSLSAISPVKYWAYCCCEDRSNNLITLAVTSMAVRLTQWHHHLSHHFLGFRYVKLRFIYHKLLSYLTIS